MLLLEESHKTPLDDQMEITNAASSLGQYLLDHYVYWCLMEISHQLKIRSNYNIVNTNLTLQVNFLS